MFPLSILFLFFTNWLTFWIRMSIFFRSLFGFSFFSFTDAGKVSILSNQLLFLSLRPVNYLTYYVFIFTLIAFGEERRASFFVYYFAGGGPIVGWS